MATAFDIIQVSIRSNDKQFPLITVPCDRDWEISRVKQEIEISHPKHFPLDVQVIYYNGIRLEDSVVLSDIFKPRLILDSPNPFYTLWLATVSDNRVIQEFLSLPKSNLSPNECHPYYSALQYYNYIHGAVGKNADTDKLTEQNELAPNPGEAAANAQRDPEGEEFNFLGGRPQGIGLEEAQEQNAIINAINLVVRLTLLLYITYQFAPQYKFYLVVAFSGVMFLYQLGIFRVNRVNIPRFQQVENQIREREINPENRDDVPNENKPDLTTKEDTPIKTEEATDEINIASDQDGNQGEETNLIPNEPPQGVLSSVKNLLYNLFISFHPEYNAQL